MSTQIDRFLFRFITLVVIVIRWFLHSEQRGRRSHTHRDVKAAVAVRTMCNSSKKYHPSYLLNLSHLKATQKRTVLMPHCPLI